MIPDTKSIFYVKKILDKVILEHKLSSGERTIDSFLNHKYIDKYVIICWYYGQQGSNDILWLMYSDHNNYGNGVDDKHYEYIIINVLRELRKYKIDKILN
jgi:hypothetical protein